MERKAFLDQEPPPGYIAGVGRGATGFTTSADTGPVRFDSQFGTEADGNDGLEAGILAQTANGSKEDDEADRIYEDIDRRLHRRRRKIDDSDPPVTKTQSVQIPTGPGIIRQDFKSLKRELAQVSMDEWANLPEVGDLTRRNKRQRLLDQQQQRTYAAPDMLISGTGSSFRESPEGSHSHLQLAEDSAAKLAEIEKWEQTSASAEDLEKSRLILASLRRAEPYKADSWISSARLEEQARQIPQARALISKGCDLIPHNDHMWLERIRLHRSDGNKICKAIMSEALRLNSQSELLWMAALDLENSGDVLSRRKVAMKALEYLPSNDKLWKILIDLESTKEDKVRLLNRATELCLDKWDLWLTLVNLSSYTDAKSVLNRARKQIPKESNVWITAMKLEEREKSEVSAEKLVSMLSKGIMELEKHSVEKDVNEWLGEAVKAQVENFSKTSQAIVNCALANAKNDDLDELFELAESLTETNSVVSSYIYHFVAERNPRIVRAWTRLLSLLKSDQTRLFKTYEQAIGYNPTNEILPLMHAKDRWLLSSDVPSARSILEKAGKVMPISEKIWVARLKLEIVDQKFSRAMEVSKEAVGILSQESPRLWYKRIHILRHCCLRKVGLLSSETLLEESQRALDYFPECAKLYIQRSQILMTLGDSSQARECLSKGTKLCPKSHLLWVSLANLDLQISAGARARSVLDMALSQIPDEPALWVAKIDLEFELKDFVMARQLINKALQKFPTYPSIWILHLKSIPKMSHRKNAFLDALKSTDNSTEILLAIGVFFWVDGKYTKARAWFDRALGSEKSNGDAWGWMYCFETRYGTQEELQELTSRFTKAYDDVSAGNTWNRVVKDPANLDKSPIELLKLVSDELPLTNA